MQCDTPKQTNEAPEAPVDDSDVCNDFKRGKCNRSNCRFSHDISKLQLCGDYQKGKCNRDKCRYAHVKEPPKPKLDDVCGDFQVGKCKRGAKCRFKHIGKDEDPTKDVCKDFQNGKCSRDRCRFRHVDEFTFQQEQMAKFGILNDSGMISYPKKDNKKIPGWDAYQQPQQQPTTQTNAFTPIWPAVPAQQRAGTDSRKYDAVTNTIPNNVPPGMRAVMEKVLEATTPLSMKSYREQINKKTKECEWVAEQLAMEIQDANSSTKGWIEFQTNKFGHCARIDKLKESPQLDGYRNKCEFAIGVNPENRKLTVGFKLDPRSAAADVGPIEHLRHIPKHMKLVVHHLERYLRGTNYKHFDYQTGTGYWVSVVVRYYCVMSYLPL